MLRVEYREIVKRQAVRMGLSLHDYMERIEDADILTPRGSNLYDAMRLAADLYRAEGMACGVDVPYAANYA